MAHPLTLSDAMTEATAPLTKTQLIAGLDPPAGGPIPAKCAGFRCLAYQDRKGVWRNWVTRRELTGEVKPG